MKRHQARRANGRFARNTLENCFGLRALICTCGAINSYGRKPAECVGSFIDPAAFNQWDVPTCCHRCGAALDSKEQQ